MDEGGLLKTIKENLRYTTTGFKYKDSTRKCGTNKKYSGTIINLKGKYYKASHLVWLLFMGKLPDKLKHLDGNIFNYKFSNLTLDRGVVNNSENLYEVCHRKFKYRDGKLYHRDSNKFAGSLTRGYYTCNIQGENYFMHRIIFLMFYNRMPDIIDHIDRDKSNNDIFNLREADKSLNSINRGAPLNNTSGKRGVTWNERTKRWNSQIKVKGKKLHLGTSLSFEEALRKREEAEIKYWGNIVN